MQDRIEQMRTTIRHTLQAISEGRRQVEQIAEATQQEVRILEAEYEEMQQACAEAIARVENLELESRKARQRLAAISRKADGRSEQDMKRVYDEAYELQSALGQWQEREVQLRLRRDEIARRLKAIRVTAQQAEELLIQFSRAAQSLDVDFGDLATTLEDAHLLRIVGMRMLNLQEDERRQLVRTLHDGPMQHLASVSMRMQSADYGRAGDRDVKRDLQERLGNVIHDLRQIVFDLRPPLLDDLGLVPTLKRYAAQWTERHDVATTVTLVGMEARLAPTEKISIFRCVQEALRNVAEHAAARHVEIRLTYGDARLGVEVRDDGVGVSTAEWSEWVENGRLGLMICRQRMAVLGGTLEVYGDNREGASGTRVVMQLPLDRGEQWGA
ncbi:MAG: sensor histidine kinase [Alicyclobacillus sp.]|nr:sensor histidine kinase [Alicyclobacillus sp.]